MAGCVGLLGAEHGKDDVAAAAGQADEGGVVRLPSVRLRSQNALGSGSRKEANAAGNMAFFSRWLPRWPWDLPLTDLPDWRVTGAWPA